MRLQVFVKLLTFEQKNDWKKSALERKSSLLFLVEDAYGEIIDHLGISDLKNKTCRIDNIARV
jgi:hypothetical protein